LGFVFLEFQWTTQQLQVDEGEVEAAGVMDGSMVEGFYGHRLWRRGVSEVRRTMESLYKVRDGQNAHQLQRIRWRGRRRHCVPVVGNS
jgi:hypothetical protein